MRRGGDHHALEWSARIFFVLFRARVAIGISSRRGTTSSGTVPLEARSQNALLSVVHPEPRLHGWALSMCSLMAILEDGHSRRFAS